MYMYIYIVHTCIYLYYSTKLSGSSAGSQAVARDKGSLHIEFPDKDRDCKKIAVHFTPQKVDKPRTCTYDHVFTMYMYMYM